MKEQTFRDKSEWPAGPWQQEPDKLNWVDPATGLDCMMVRNHFGVWCGYVGVPEGHPLYQADYRDYDNMDFDVHGGLTFAGACAPEETPEPKICHTPEPGRPEVWWLGFDTGHMGDLPPNEPKELAPIWERLNKYRTYRDLEYVKGQVTDLARQIKERT